MAINAGESMLVVLLPVYARTVLGGGPFAFGYALPWALGIDPPAALQLTVIPLGLVPLAFASAMIALAIRALSRIVRFPVRSAVQ